MNTSESLAHGLREHLQLCQDTLALVEREHRALRHPGGAETARYQGEKKDLLSRLQQSLNQLRQLRVAWMEVSGAERVRHPHVTALLRQNQDVIMKTVMLDRENEQVLLRRGMSPLWHGSLSQRPQPLGAAIQRRDRLPCRP
jgi:hypothetical protein